MVSLGTYICMSLVQTLVDLCWYTKFSVINWVFFCLNEKYRKLVWEINCIEVLQWILTSCKWKMKATWGILGEKKLFWPVFILILPLFFAYDFWQFASKLKHHTMLGIWPQFDKITGIFACSPSVGTVILWSKICWCCPSKQVDDTIL